MAKFMVSCTHAKDNADKATVSFVVANASVASGQDTVVFLSIEGVRLATPGYADDIHEEGFAPLERIDDQLHRGRRTDLAVQSVFQEAWVE